MKKIISATEFMQQKSAPKRSKLAPFQDDILLLKQNGYTDMQVLEFLAMNGVKVAQSTLNQFVHSRKQQLQNATNDAASVQTTQTQIAEQQAENVPETQVKPKPRPQIKKGIQKFDWKNATTDGLI